MSNVNDAWADDPDLRVQEMDDVDSRRLLKGLRIVFWPWPTLLIILWLAAITFDVEFLSGPLIFGTLLWLTAHLLFRTKKFLNELRSFGEAVAAQLSKLMQWLDQAAKGSKAEAPAVAKSKAPLAAASLQSSAPKPDPEQPEADPAGAVTKFFKAVGKHWGLLLIAFVAVIALIFAQKIIDIFDGPSGREVVAQVEARDARAEQATSDAETEQMADALARLEAAAAKVERLSRQAEQARHAIQTAPDLDGGIVAHREYVDGVRRDAADARAAAVRDYGAAIDP